MGLEYFIYLKTDKTPEEMRQEFVSLFSLDVERDGFLGLFGKHCNFSVNHYYNEDNDHDENGDDIGAAIACPGATIAIWIYPQKRDDISLEMRDQAALAILTHYRGDFAAELASTDVVILVRRNNILYYDDEGIDVALIRESGYDMSRVVKGIPRQYQFRSFE